MKNIRGFVFVYIEDGGYYIFGRGDATRPYFNIESNGLVPFLTLEEAARTAHAFDVARNLIANPSITDFCLDISDSPQEAEERFKEESNLVIVEDQDGGVRRLIGDYLPGRSHVTADKIGAYFFDNELMAINVKRGKSAFDRVVYIAGEVARQHQSPVKIAKLDLLFRKDSFHLLQEVARSQ